MSLAQALSGTPATVSEDVANDVTLTQNLVLSSASVSSVQLTAGSTTLAVTRGATTGNVYDDQIYTPSYGALYITSTMGAFTNGMTTETFQVNRSGTYNVVTTFALNASSTWAAATDTLNATIYTLTPSPVANTVGASLASGVVIPSTGTAYIALEKNIVLSAGIPYNIAYGVTGSPATPANPVITYIRSPYDRLAVVSAV